jgi:hypothetical protein
MSPTSVAVIAVLAAIVIATATGDGNGASSTGSNAAEDVAVAETPAAGTDSATPASAAAVVDAEEAAFAGIDLSQAAVAAAVDKAVRRSKMDALEAKRSLHVALICIPLYGHFMPMKAVAEHLLRRGHTVTVFTENTAWCATTVGTFRCVELRESDAWPPALYATLSRLDDLGASFPLLFDAMFEHQRSELGHFLAVAGAAHAADPFDLVFHDSSTYVGRDVAHHFDVPYAAMFPLVTHMPLGPATALPAIGTGFPRAMSFLQRCFNFVIKLLVPVVAFATIDKVNAVRAANNMTVMYRSFAEFLGMHGPIYGPTVWGFDVPHAVCPNVIPLGVLTPSHDHAPLEPATAAFLEGCAAAGVAYVNFGTLAVVSDRLFRALAGALVTRSTKCVVWKITDADQERQARAMIAEAGADARFLISTRFTNPAAIMARSVVFVTHCGTTSLGEALAAALPLVGVPIFADQGDVCQRLDEQGMGVYAGHKHTVTEVQLAAALATVDAKHAAMVARLRQLHAASATYGGGARGAEVLEQLTRSGSVNRYLPCAFADPALYPNDWVAWVVEQQLDVLVLGGLLPLWGLYRLLRGRLPRLAGAALRAARRLALGEAKEKEQ